MKELKLRGYVCPEDFEGTDAERLQKALDVAKKEDIAKVVLRGEYRADKTIIVPNGMHLVLDKALLCADLKNDFSDNYSFESDRIYIEGNNALINGDINFCHTRHVVLEDIEINGDVTLYVSRDFRIEYVEISGALTLGRGTQNAIIQQVRCANVTMSGKDRGYDVAGRERIFKNIILRDSEIAGGVTLLAAEDCGFLNVQVNDISARENGVVIGEKGVALPAEQYKNLTLVNIKAREPVVFNNEHLHVYIK